MRCYFSIGDDEYLKGRVICTNGEDIYFDADDKSKMAKTLTLRKPEILFSKEIIVTGLHQIEWNKYEYVSVSIRWTPPRKKKS